MGQSMDVDRVVIIVILSEGIGICILAPIIGLTFSVVIK